MLTGYSMTWGTIGVFFAEAFDGAVRYTGLSIGFTLGVILGGAVTPLVLTKLVADMDSGLPVVLWIAASTVISALCALSVRQIDAPSRRSGADHVVRNASLH
ncbi:hypothetical protein [Rhodococcus sp. 15-649-2-2]|uniref:hypothetical protein n=1 Tax=Rhodococcus sp. 15-649-2-2 TaxID=2023140 RepID=UPI00211AE125|nr:hypothetical protein [Rhodococcus sp. 15-649-2-2]